MTVPSGNLRHEFGWSAPGIRFLWNFYFFKSTFVWESKLPFAAERAFATIPPRELPGAWKNAAIAIAIAFAMIATIAIAIALAVIAAIAVQRSP